MFVGEKVDHAQSEESEFEFENKTINNDKNARNRNKEKVIDLTFGIQVKKKTKEVTTDLRESKNLQELNANEEANKKITHQTSCQMLPGQESSQRQIRKSQKYKKSVNNQQIDKDDCICID